MEAELCSLLESTLGLPAGAIPANPATCLLGAIPELDSMSVVSFLIAIEESYGFTIDDDEVDAALFETVGALAEFVAARLA